MSRCGSHSGTMRSRQPVPSPQLSRVLRSRTYRSAVSGSGLRPAVESTCWAPTRSSAASLSSASVGTAAAIGSFTVTRT